MPSSPHSSFTFTLGDLHPAWGTVGGVGGERGVVRGGEAGFRGDKAGWGIGESEL